MNYSSKSQFFVEKKILDWKIFGRSNLIEIYT